MSVIEKPETIGLKPFGEFDEANRTWPRGDRPAVSNSTAGWSRRARIWPISGQHSRRPRNGWRVWIVRSTFSSATW